MSCTPVNRIPIMAKQVLDLYMLYKLVTEKGGLVEVINKKIWREITRGLNLPTSNASALNTKQKKMLYMKYLYPYESEKKGLSSPGELQAAIDGNRREGRRPSNSLYHFPSTIPGQAPLSPSKMPHHSLLSPSKMPHHSLLSPSKMPHHSLLSAMSTPMTSSRLPMANALPRAAAASSGRMSWSTSRAKLERGGEGPDRKMTRLVMEEEQRLMQQAFQQNLLAMASHFNPGMKQLNNNNRHGMLFAQNTLVQPP
ncbi:AT-rich interactive domain-containing protein 3A-like [Oncorhynchus nerka]|uniref:AT-rich interactive domain-containing protein 3A-like n=1 Tax=Oncorhynchus nerka TaxID=8023 RepID=UPI0031B83F71